ncbi:MAG TPA: hypothetical protein VFV07_02755 [Rhizomicrobium sp.]|nr:hypothetical protein [Rhizomicrobium sp.]
MNLARWRFPVSIRHDVVIPALVVIGLWIVAAWYYGMNTYAGGVVATPDQAVAAIKQRCGGHNAPDWMNWRMRTKLKNETWFTYLKLIDYHRLHTYGVFWAAVDAKTGQVQDCVYHSTEF